MFTFCFWFAILCRRMYRRDTGILSFRTRPPNGTTVSSSLERIRVIRLCKSRCSRPQRELPRRLFYIPGCLSCKLRSADAEQCKHVYSRWKRHSELFGTWSNGMLICNIILENFLHTCVYVIASVIMKVTYVNNPN